METDRTYFAVGLFIIGFSVAAALFAIWLVGAGHRDDVLYRIHFADSVTGLSVGDAVKFHGVDVGTVKAIALDPNDQRLAQVDVLLHKGVSVKTDTRATLVLKGVTGVVYIELNGGSPNAPVLLASTGDGPIPEIPSEKSSLNATLDMLPKLLERFASIESQVKKVLTDVNGITNEIKENPSVLLRGPKEKPTQHSKDAIDHGS